MTANAPGGRLFFGASGCRSVLTLSSAAASCSPVSADGALR